VRVDAQPPTCAPDRAVQDMRAIQSIGRLGFALAAELEARCPSDDLEPGAARQAVDNLLASAGINQMTGGARHFIDWVVDPFRGDGAPPAR
jgi:hypothetical protein